MSKILALYNHEFIAIDFAFNPFDTNIFFDAYVPGGG